MTILSPLRQKSGAVLALAIGLAALPAAPMLAQDSAYQLPADFTRMVAEKLPAVVGILSTGPAPDTAAGPAPQLPPALRDFFGAPGQQQQPPPGPMRSQGSGFIISADGYIVTNNHVIAGAEKIEVVLGDDRQFVAQLIGTDPATDIALLKIEADQSLPMVEWGSSDDLQIGEWVVAIGNPFGLGGTVTAGIVSARSRNINSGPYDDFIQTDAAINRGNSGGPLFNAPGEVVGVNTAIFSPTGGSVGIGFAVPSMVAQRIVEDLREDGSVERGWLGVQAQPLDDALKAALGLDDESGALLAQVTEGSPAAEAGLRVGDVITRIGAAEVGDPRSLTFAVADLETGEPVEVTYLRDGQQATAEVVIGLRPDASAPPARQEARPAPADGPMIGVSVAPVTPELRQELGLPQDVNGLAIAAVQPGSPAAASRLNAGDVIVQVGGQAAGDIGALRAALRTAEAEGKPLLVRIYRNGGYAFRAVEFANDTAAN